MDPVARSNSEFTTVDVCKFCAESVFAADGLFFRVVVIGRCQEVAEDEFGHHNLVFGMFRNGNSLAVVTNRDFCGCQCDGDHRYLVGCGFGCGSRYMIQSVYDEFVENLEKSRIVGDFAPDHFNCCWIVNPAMLGMG